MAIPTPPLNAGTVREIDYLTLVKRINQGPEQPYAVYQFGNGRKTFYNNLQGEGVYGKPVSVSGGVTTHLPDPDLISTNP